MSGLALTAAVVLTVRLCGDCAEILEGGVKIIQNKYLSFASHINWLDIVKDGTTADIVIEENGPQSEWEVTLDAAVTATGPFKIKA